MLVHDGEHLVGAAHRDRKSHGHDGPAREEDEAVYRVLETVRVHDGSDALLQRREVVRLQLEAVRDAVQEGQHGADEGDLKRDLRQALDVRDTEASEKAQGGVRAHGERQDEEYERPPIHGGR